MTKKNKPIANTAPLKAKAKKSPQDMHEKKIETLLNSLNNPKTGCTFWRGELFGSHIMGVRPVERTTKTVINENGFNPLEKLSKETFVRMYFIKVLNNKPNKKDDEDFRKTSEILESKSIVYLVNNDIDYIYEYIRGHA